MALLLWRNANCNGTYGDSYSKCVYSVGHCGRWVLHDPVQGGGGVRKQAKV